MRAESGTSTILSDPLQFPLPPLTCSFCLGPAPELELLTLLVARIDEPGSSPNIRANSHWHLGSWGTMSFCGLVP